MVVSHAAASFADRTEAGARLGERVVERIDRLDRRSGWPGRHRDLGQGVAVLGLPRGGVPVAFEVARALEAPLDVVVVRKLGVPSQPELAMGAIGEDGVRVLDRRVVADAHVTEADISAVAAREHEELERRVARLRRDRPRLAVADRLVVIVDDGMATGSTARAACQVVRQLGAAFVVVAVPVGSADTVRRLREADEVICLVTPSPFRAVGLHYRDFTPTTEAEVIALLDRASDG